MEVPAQHRTLLSLHGSACRGASAETFKPLLLSGLFLGWERSQLLHSALGGPSARPQAA